MSENSYKRQLAQEKAARKKAEVLLEQKSAELRAAQLELKKHLKKESAKLQEIGQRYNALFNNTSVGVLLSDMEGNYLELNKPLLKLLGYSKSIFKTLPFSKVIHPLDFDRVKGYVDQFKSNELSALNFETRVITKHGKTKWIKVMSTSIQSDSNVTEFISLVEDITEFKKSITLLEQNEEKWRSVIENMQLSLVEVDIEGKVTKAYDRFCEVSGYSKKELLGKHPIPLLVKDKKSLKVYEENLKLRKAGKNTVYELEVIKKNGEKGWFIISGAPLKDEEGNLTGGIGIHMDITDRKQLLNDLEKAKETAEDSSKAKENFLASMSHEIRTPMNAVIGMTRLLKESTNAADKEVYLDAIETSSENLLVIINDILDISKIEANKLDIEFIPFSLKKVLNEVHMLLSLKAEEKGVLLQIKQDPKIHNWLIGDPVRLNQILTNLVSNAIKFTERGSVEIGVQLVREHKDKCDLKIVVSDTGIGISKKNQNKIFESFTQADQTTSRKFGGTGLGLTITKKLVELFGGVIKMKSKKNKGTEFWFEITLKKGREGAEDKEAAKQLNLKAVKGTKVLLVEDHEMNKLLAETILTSWNMDVTHAYNGQEAIDILETSQFEIILMDMQMPVLDGISATNQIRKSGLITPIIALTANAIKGDQEKCINAGMDDYVTKPIKPSILFNTIITYLNK